MRASRRHARYTTHMTFATTIVRQRRVLVLIGASVLLHYMAIGWAGAQLGAPLDVPAPAVPPVMVAALHAPVAPPMVATPQRAPARAAARKRAPAPPERGAAEPAAQVQSAAPEPESTAVQEAEVAEAVEPPQVAELGDLAPAPRYKVSLPPPAELTLDVERTDGKGVSWSGQAVMDWRRNGNDYRLSWVASATMVVTINLVELTSEGTVDTEGIVPRRMTEKRRNRAQTATHFDQEQGRITFSASQASHALAPGAQDKATFPMQLAGIGRADPEQFKTDIELLVGEDKDASLFRFVLVGQEEIDTGMGKLATWRLTRPPLPGSYSSRLDVWLAPGHNWYPVQVRSTEAKGAITTQTIRTIVAKQED